MNTVRRIINWVKDYLDSQGTVQLAAIPTLAGFLVLFLAATLVSNQPYTGQPLVKVAIRSGFFLFGCGGFPFILRREALVFRGWPAVLWGWSMVIVGWFMAVWVPM